MITHSVVSSARDQDVDSMARARQVAAAHSRSHLNSREGLTVFVVVHGGLNAPPLIHYGYQGGHRVGLNTNTVLPVWVTREYPGVRVVL